MKTQVLVGGERKMFYAAGETVPAIDAKDNVDGYYVLTAKEMNALLNP